MIGQIVKILSNDYFVDYENEIYVCKSKGKFRYDNIIPLVGDYVNVNINEKIITDVILPRKNDLVRPKVANVDQAFIVTSLKRPDFSDNLLDKLLIICEINNIKPVICLTKKDLLKEEEYKILKATINYYKKIGYRVIFNYNLFTIKRLLKNKTTVFTGQTGSGKSTLINRLDKTLNFETNDISLALGRGKHTTRHIELVNMYHGKVLDTPGFSSIDLGVYSKEQIKKAFIEFAKIKCPYQDCNHLNEKECLVKKAIGKYVLKSRYDNYKKIIESLDK